MVTIADVKAAMDTVTTGTIFAVPDPEHAEMMRDAIAVIQDFVVQIEAATVRK